MADHVKSIDGNHLLEIGLEGFYGESLPEMKQFNPGYEVGTDFISNNQINRIDFVTIHAYPDQWSIGEIKTITTCKGSVTFARADMTLRARVSSTMHKSLSSATSSAATTIATIAGSTSTVVALSSTRTRGTLRVAKLASGATATSKLARCWIIFY
ncbi:hypothetical protein H6P81_012903 [Aristolochia fimbriata]|uniref:Uncharacterized protein n=1 Tax=Aristolochia fimbriata TaxID=158543 RepID=A0AAV7ED40_ARIFI|nr:hypothetical protein H6P81_012903 [Aristolochia fimbriata]